MKRVALAVLCAGSMVACGTGATGGAGSGGSAGTGGSGGSGGVTGTLAEFTASDMVAGVERSENESDIAGWASSDDTSVFDGSTYNGTHVSGTDFIGSFGFIVHGKPAVATYTEATVSECFMQVILPGQPPEATWESSKGNQPNEPDGGTCSLTFTSVEQFQTSSQYYVHGTAHGTLPAVVSPATGSVTLDLTF